MAPRWVLVSAEQRQPPAQRAVATQWRKPRAQAVQACQPLCRTAFACEAEAQQALTRLVASLQTTFLSESPVCPTPHYGKRGRPGPGAEPAHLVSHIAGAWASRLPGRQARVDPQRCFLLATNERDAGQLWPQAVRDGDQGQARAERGCRFLKAPQFLASSLSRKKPERSMALWRGMTVGVLVYAALEYRIRTTLKDTGATCPAQKGRRLQHPTARWVFHYFVGMHGLDIPGQGLMVLPLTDEPWHLLALLGKRYAWFYR